MGFQMIDIPADIEPLFVAAGWRQGVRKFDSAISGLPDSLAEQIISEFGGLRVGKCGAGIDLATSDVRFLITPDPDKGGAVEEWTHVLGPLSAIADAHHEHMMIFVSAGGDYFFFTDPDEKMYLGGRSFGEAMRKLLLGLSYGPEIEPNQTMEPTR